MHAGFSIPPDRVATDARQLHSAFALAAGPNVQPIPLTPDAGIGQGGVSVDRDLGSGYVQQWNTSLQRELASDISVEVAYAGSKITRVGLPDTKLHAKPYWPCFW